MKNKTLTLDDVAGLEEQKEALHTSLILPQLKPELYESLIKRPDMVRERNVFLFHGPPGTGKTMLAQAISNEMSYGHLEINATEFINKYRGEGARQIRDLYNLDGKKLFFVDEIDAISRSRNSFQSESTYDVLMQFLMVLDGPGAKDDKVTIFSTNKKDSLDDAFLSRIPEDNRLYFPAPDANQREKIITKHLSYFNHRIEDISSLVSDTEGYTGRSIEMLFGRAKKNALKKEKKYLDIDDFYNKITYFEKR
ncbi:MAG: AAA family ATPase [Nanobdellota archaeon]